MKIVNVLEKDTKEKDIKFEKGLIECTNVYDICNYDQIKYNFVYSKCDELFNNDVIHIYAREYKNSLFKFVLCESIESLNSFDYSNEALKKYSSNRTLEFVNDNSFDLNKTICIIIVCDKYYDKDLVKKFCFLNTKSTNELYQVAFRFDENYTVLRQYRLMPDFSKLFRLYNTALKFDVGATNLKKED